MERQDFINWLVKAQAQFREFGMRGFDLDDDNDLRIIFPSEHFCMFNSYDEDGEPCTYLVCVTPEARKVYSEEAAGPNWPEFEKDLREALGSL